MSLTHDSINVSGTLVNIVEGMVRLKDIHDAHMITTGGKDEVSTRPNQWRRLYTSVKLLDHLFSTRDPETVLSTPFGKKGGLYACVEVANSYAIWLNPLHILSIFEDPAYDSIYDKDDSTILDPTFHLTLRDTYLEGYYDGSK